MTFDICKAEGKKKTTLLDLPDFGGTGWTEKKAKAKAHQEKLKLDFDKTEDLLCLLMEAFEWQATPQGDAYWHVVYENIGNLFNSVLAAKEL